MFIFQVKIGPKLYLDKESNSAVKREPVGNKVPMSCVITHLLLRLVSADYSHGLIPSSILI